MYTITKLTTQKSSSKRFNVFLDNQYAFSISEDLYVKFHLHKGKKLTDEQIAAIKYEDHLHRGYLSVINYLSYRMRTESEIRSYLYKSDIETKVVDTIISRLYEEKLINDEQFAMSFVKDRMNRSTKGPLLVGNELGQKGVAREHIERALTLYSSKNETEIASRWLKKELRKNNKLPKKRRKEQLTMKLIRRGFRRDIVNELMNSIEIESNVEDEFLLLKKEGDKLYTKYKKKYDDRELVIRLKQRLYARGFDLSQIDQYIQTL